MIRFAESREALRFLVQGRAALVYTSTLLGMSTYE
jgi:hypothetical protein